VSSEATETAEGVHPSVRGIGVDAQTRCIHYCSPLDIIAIKMKCCGDWYACKDCHEVLAGHELETWPRSQWDEPAIVCGACGFVMSIRNYLERGDACPACRAPFNPACRDHHHFYFEAAQG
jgi:uncharacterized CHY-type Zn-finger protein